MPEISASTESGASIGTSWISGSALVTTEPTEILATDSTIASRGAVSTTSWLCRLRLGVVLLGLHQLAARIGEVLRVLAIPVLDEGLALGLLGGELAARLVGIGFRAASEAAMVSRASVAISVLSLLPTCSSWSF